MYVWQWIFFVTVTICCSSSDGTKCLKTNDKNRLLIFSSSPPPNRKLYEWKLPSDFRKYLFNKALHFRDLHGQETARLPVMYSISYYTDFARAFLTFKMSKQFHGACINSISLMSIRKLLPSARRFSWNSQLLNSIMWRFILNNTHISQEIQELGVEVCWCP
jgi:hypothetical protein